ncbi:hypothetical protein CapIbe_005922 [Capra ibex]
MNSSDLTEASFGKPRMEKNTVADKPIKEDETAHVRSAAEAHCGELGPSGERTKHQRDRWETVAKGPGIPAAPPRCPCQCRTLQGSLTSRGKCWHSSGSISVFSNELASLHQETTLVYISLWNNEALSCLGPIILQNITSRVKKKRNNFLCSNIMKRPSRPLTVDETTGSVQASSPIWGCAGPASSEQGSHQAEGMRTHGLTLLSLLLLAVLMLLAEAKKEGRKRHGSKASTEESHALGKPGKEPRSQLAKHLIKGKFVTPDHADCRWAVTKQEEGLVLKVECTQQDNTFSCFFTGNPTSCLELHKSSVYWKQIGRNLRSQKVICGDAKSVLKTRVCRKKFPESNLKLVNSTLIRIKKPSQKLMEPSPMDTVEVTTFSNPEKTQTMTTKGPQCEDEDLENQRKAAQEYCGEVWGSLCRFFLSMVQGSSC